MTTTGTLTVTTPTEREIVISRAFAAPRHLVFRALTTPDLLRRWFVGPSGWTLTVCEIGLRVGGRYRFVWSGERGEMGMGGVYREVEPPGLYSATEVFDEPWYPGEGLARSVLVEEDGTTTLTTTVLYESMEARDIAAGSGMETGLAAAYDALERLLWDGEADPGR